jgi:hypothetical protein
MKKYVHHGKALNIKEEKWTGGCWSLQQDIKIYFQNF